MENQKETERRRGTRNYKRARRRSQKVRCGSKNEESENRARKSKDKNKLTFVFFFFLRLPWSSHSPPASTTFFPQNVSREEHPRSGQPAPRHQCRGRRRLPGKVRGEKISNWPPIETVFFSFPFACRGALTADSERLRSFFISFFDTEQLVALQLASVHAKKDAKAAQGLGRASSFLFLHSKFCRPTSLNDRMLILFFSTFPSFHAKTTPNRSRWPTRSSLRKSTSRCSR